MLKLVLLSVFLPPTCFLYLALLGLFLLTRRPRIGFIFCWIGLVGLLITALPVVAGTLMSQLEQGIPRISSPDAKPRAIVILGGEIQKSRDSPFALPGSLTAERLRKGAELWRRVKLPILVTGGIVQPGRPPVGRVMADSLRDDYQIPVQWVEDNSATTWDNAVMSAEILKKQGISSVYLVTNAWHMRRALIAFRRAGVAVTAVPTSIDAPDYKALAAYIPSQSAWEGTYFAAHEWIGCAWYELR